MDSTLIIYMAYFLLIIFTKPIVSEFHETYYYLWNI